MFWSNLEVNSKACINNKSLFVQTSTFTKRTRTRIQKVVGFSSFAFKNRIREDGHFVFIWNKTENTSKAALDQSEISAKCKIMYSADMCKVILHNGAPCIILHIVWTCILHRFLYCHSLSQSVSHDDQYVHCQEMLAHLKRSWELRLSKCILKSLLFSFQWELQLRSCSRRWLVRGGEAWEVRRLREHLQQVRREIYIGTEISIMIFYHSTCVITNSWLIGAWLDGVWWPVVEVHMGSASQQKTNSHHVTV